MTGTVGATTYCTAKLNYQHDFQTVVAVDTAIADGRAALDDISFEESGFTLADHESSVADWTDSREVDSVHGPEIHDIAVSFSGCDAAAVYPSIIRSPVMAGKVADYAPIEFVHSDFTEDYLGMITEPDRPYRAFLEPTLATWGLSAGDVRSAGRVMMLQFWRNTGPLLPDHPLAICDARDATPDRLLREVIAEYGNQTLEFETFGLTPPSGGQHDRWYTFPAMTRDEVLIFRTYDSARARDGLPFWTMHSAFRDPEAPGDEANRRESVEMRALCLWFD